MWVMIVTLFSVINIHLIAQEIATLRKETQAFRRVRTALRSQNDNEEAARLAFEKVCSCVEHG